MNFIKRALTKLISWCYSSELQKAVNNAKLAQAFQNVPLSLSDLNSSYNSMQGYSPYNYNTQTLTTSAISALTPNSIASLTNGTYSIGTNTTPSPLFNVTNTFRDFKDATINLKFYSASGGFVVEMTNNKNSCSTLHILRHEHVGEQLEKILAIEFLRN
jgi:hypothetical protein